MPRKAAPTQTTSAKTATPTAASGATAKKARKPRATKTAAPATPVAETVTETAAPVETQPIASGLQDEFAEFLGKLNQLAS